MDEVDWAWFDARSRGVQAAALLTHEFRPACWLWPVPDDIYDTPAQRAWDEMSRRHGVPVARGHTPHYALVHWQASRCALCGAGHDYYNGAQVEDHDHRTGLVRGWLCRGCNIHEGFCNIRICPCARYRLRPPTAILGVTIEYTGRESSWADLERRKSGGVD